MTILSRHIFKEFITLVLGVLIGLIVVFLCVEFLQKADKLIKFHATIPQVAKYFLYTVPSMITRCAVLAGIHTPRTGGTTQLPASVSTRMTPLPA